MFRATKLFVAGAGWVAILMAPVIGACAGVTAPPFAHAIAGNGCTQEDIPGLEIFLTANDWKGEKPATAPYIRIEMTRLRTELAVDVELSPLKRDPAQRTLARAALHAADKTSPTWLSGSMHVQQDVTTRFVRGSYSFCAEDRRCFSGSFIAPWRPGSARCG